MRFPEFSGEWKKCIIQDYGEVITGNTPPTNNAEYYNNGSYLWASPADLGTGKKINDTKTKLSESGFKKTRIIPKGSILVTCIGSTIGNIGMAVAIVSSEEFQDLKELTLSILRYIHEIESYEIADKVKEYKKYKNRIEDFFDIFLMWFRDIMLLKADNSVNAEAAKKKIIFKNEYAYLKKQEDKLDLEAIDYVIGKIHRARVRIKSNVNFDATLELLIVEARREF